MGGSQELPDRYDVVRSLGGGGSGSVWLCRDTYTAHRLVAVKLLLAGSAAGRQAFRSEFATLSSLHHPSIPEVFDFDELAGGRCCFALEYVDGPSFVEAVATDFGVFVPLAVEALQALSLVHDFNLLHRDLKPENLLVRREPRGGTRLVMLDFGLAEGRDATAQALGGTLAYIAPELFDGSVPTIKTDLWALGVLFQHALLGRHPVEVDPATDLGGYLESMRGTVEMPADVPKRVVRWLAALRAHDPSERPSAAAEALAQLRSILPDAVAIESSGTRAARMVSGTPPGRRSELEAIRRDLEDDRTTAVFLTGEAGIGKTRLLDVVRAEAVRHGWVLKTAQDFLAADSPLEDVSHRHSLWIVDELENAGPEIVTLLDRWVRRPAQDKIKILAAGRVEEITDARIRSLLSDVDFLPTATRCDLGRLDAVGVGEVLTRASGISPSDAQVRQLLEASGGLPAALETLVVEGAGGGDGAERLRASIAARFKNLSPPAATCVVSLAVIGGPTEPALLEAIVGDCDLASALDEIHVSRLARSRQHRWELDSAMIHDTVLLHANPAQVSQITHTAIEVVAASSSPNKPAKLAHLWRQLGERSRAAEFAATAAREAADAGLDDLSFTWWTQAALDVPKHDPRYAELRWEHARVSEKIEDFWSAAKSYAAVLRCNLRKAPARSEILSLKARALIKAGRQAAATRAADAAYACASDQRERWIAGSILGNTLAVGKDTDRAMALLSRAPEELSSMGESRWAAEAFHGRAMAMEKAREFKAAAEAYATSVRYARAHDQSEVVVNSLIALSNVDIGKGDAGSALEHLDRASELADRANSSRHQQWILAGKGRTFEILGRRDRSLQCIQQARTKAQFLGHRAQQAAFQVTVADNLIALGRPAQAETALRELLKSPLSGPTRVYALLTLAEALLHRNDPMQRDVETTLAAVEAEEKRPALADWGLTVVWLEKSAQFQEAPPEGIRRRFKEFLDQEGLDQQILARGWLAWSKEKTRCHDRKAALEACAKALQALEGRYHDLAAQVYLSMSKAHKLEAAHVASNLAFARAQEELEKAANLIEDEDLRNDFLSRPVFRELRKKTETFADAEERLGALYDMVHALNHGGDPEGRLGVILDQALRVVRAERGLILLKSAGDDRYQVRFSRNLEEQTIEEAAQFSRSAVLSAGKGESVLAVHAASDDRLRQMKSVSAYGITSLLCVPLRVRDELVGAVYVDSRSDGALFQKQDLQFLEAFADHAALALENARDLRRLEQQHSQLLSSTESRESFGALVGRSPEMQKVYAMTERVAESDLPVLILGESGTGKELVAREIYLRGLRKGKPFLSENCAAIAVDLIESELFGHVKGAFTGADRDKAGLFEQADGGTLFLDEVGDMSPAMQARLLRVLQEGEIRRIGAETRRHVDVRLITATHRDLNQRVAAGQFRPDLLYRLQVLGIRLPPLRVRPMDIAPLVRHFLETIAAQRERKAIAVRTDAMELFERYAWPGNVRQLENTLHRLALLADGDAISRATIEQDAALSAALIGQTGWPTLSLKHNERDQVAGALRRAGGNRADAARLLGVSRATIFRKIKEHKLS